MLLTNWQVSKALSSIIGMLRHWNHRPASRSGYPLGCLTSAMKCGGRSLMVHLLHCLAWEMHSAYDLDEGFFVRFLSFTGGVHLVLLPVFLAKARFKKGQKNLTV